MESKKYNVHSKPPKSNLYDKNAINLLSITIGLQNYSHYCYRFICPFRLALLTSYNIIRSYSGIFWGFTTNTWIWKGKWTILNKKRQNLETQLNGRVHPLLLFSQEDCWLMNMAQILQGKATVLHYKTLPFTIKRFPGFQLLPFGFWVSKNVSVNLSLLGAPSLQWSHKIGVEKGSFKN